MGGLGREYKFVARAAWGSDPPHTHNLDEGDPTQRAHSIKQALNPKLQATGVART